MATPERHTVPETWTTPPSGYFNRSSRRSALFIQGCQRKTRRASGQINPVRMDVRGTCQHPEKRRPADQFHSHVLCQTAARKLRRDKQPGSKILTTDEKASLEKLEESIKYVDGRYQVAIPWKDDECALPNNYEMALRRLLNTEKRLLKNPEIGEAYTNNVN